MRVGVSQKPNVWHAGSIVNAPLGRIYLMTADHCFTDKNEISDFEYWMLLFNYVAACGNDTSPAVTQVIQVPVLTIPWLSAALMLPCRASTP